MGSCSSLHGLACCHGYRVAAGELDIGIVETPIFCGASSEPEFLLVRTCDAIAGTFKIVPTAFVAELDSARRSVELALDAVTLDALPHRLPLTHVATELPA